MDVDKGLAMVKLWRLGKDKLMASTLASDLQILGEDAKVSELIDGHTHIMVEIESNIIDSILSNEVELTKKNPLCSQLLQDTLIWWVIQKDYIYIYIFLVWKCLSSGVERQKQSKQENA